MRSLGVTANGFKKLFDTLVTLFFTERRARDMLPRVVRDACMRGDYRTRVRTVRLSLVARQDPR
jgi:hypothetical protein